MILNVGNEKLQDLLKAIQKSVNEGKYSWRELERKIPLDRILIKTSMAREDIPDLLVFKPALKPIPVGLIAKEEEKNQQESKEDQVVRSLED
jgi:hypothetical protein